MGDGEAPVVAQEFKYYLRVGSMLSTGKKFDDISLSVPVTIMARIRLARIAFKFTKLQNLNLGSAIFGTRRVAALESRAKKIAY
jgi:hypothetical protein